MNIGEELQIVQIEGEEFVTISDASDMMNELAELRIALYRLANGYAGNAWDVGLKVRITEAREALKGWKP